MSELKVALMVALTATWAVLLLGVMPATEMTPAGLAPPPPPQAARLMKSKITSVILQILEHVVPKFLVQFSLRMAFSFPETTYLPRKESVQGA